MVRHFLLPALTVLVLGFAQATEVSVKVIALFTGKAMLQVNGKQKIVQQGETFEGVLLKSATGRGAVVVIDGKESKLNLNQSIAGNFKKPERANLRIYPDSVGMYSVKGKINKQATQFLVDTGANVVVLTQGDARAAGIDPDRLTYTTPVTTANGRTTAARIRLDTLQVGEITRRRVETLIARPGALDTSLLGMSFLSTLHSFEFRGDRLILTD